MRTITTEEFLSSNTLNKQHPIFFDIETEELYYNCSLMQFRQSGTAYLVRTNTNSEVEALKEFMKPLHLVGYNLSYDFGTLNMVSARVDDLFYAAKITFPLFQEFSLDKVTTKLGLGHLYQGLDKKALQKQGFIRQAYLSQRQLEYAAADVEALELMWSNSKIQETIAKNQAYKLSIFSLKEAMVWQNNGLPIIKETLDKYLAQAKAKDANYSSQLTELVGFQLNPRSSKQIKEYFGTESSDKATMTRIVIEGRLETSTTSATGRGITAQASSFDEKQRKVAELILEARKARNDISKLTGYVGNPRMYGRFNPMGAGTARWTCKGTTKGASRGELFNAQNYSRDFKAVFGVARDSGLLILAADYATLEIRIAACIMQEDNMHAALVRGEDIHKTTASLIYNKPIDQIDGKERSNSKVANFGLSYGMGLETFIQYAYDLYGIKFTKEEAKILIGKFFKAYPKLKQYHNMVGNRLRKKNYITMTALGYRHAPPRYAEAINSPTQGTGGECMRLAIHKLIEADPDASKYVINSIHDALYMLIPEAEKAYWSKLLVESMQQAWYVIRESPVFKWHDIPMPVEVMSGYTMGELTDEFEGGGQALSLEEMRLAKEKLKK